MKRVPSICVHELPPSLSLSPSPRSHPEYTANTHIPRPTYVSVHSSCDSSTISDSFFQKFAGDEEAHSGLASRFAPPAAEHCLYITVTRSLLKGRLLPMINLVNSDDVGSCSALGVSATVLLRTIER